MFRRRRPRWRGVPTPLAFALTFTLGYVALTLWTWWVALVLACVVGWRLWRRRKR